MSEPAIVSDDAFVTGLSIFDPDNPFSLINLVDSEKMQEAFKRIQRQCSRMLLSPEIEIEKWAKPTDLIGRLRLAFWDEYERAMQTRTRLRVLGFVRQHCDIAYFYQVVVKNNGFLCYIITPPRKYELTMRQILDKANT
jgi:hypothetical protein